MSEYCSELMRLIFFRYLVTPLMGADLNNIIKTQKLTDDHVQFLIYQILRGLKVCIMRTRYATFCIQA
jgi:hypothetical protein